MKMFKQLIFAVAVFVASVHAETITGRVIKVLDGDTISILDQSNTQHRIRFAQIDAPEKSQVVLRKFYLYGCVLY